MRKTVAYFVILIIFSLVANACPILASSGLEEGASSLIVPGWGQYINGEFQTDSGRLKSGTMIAVEIAAIITVSVVGGVAGYPLVWIGIGLLLANHIWSSLDAYLHAEPEPGIYLGTASFFEQPGIK
ncbi:MAG: hypothetical protein EXS63_06895 [Candidatus Omnitrophica bacterium]|nr:hypothetical protein [Candidatus Omnitrophota bacterium]